MKDHSELIDSIDRLHTTDLGVQRIARNIACTEENAVSYCKELIRSDHAKIIRNGKNYYIRVNNIEITVNAYSYTIITAHKIRKD